MTRLRLAPSSSERMAGQIRTLIMRQGYSSAYWTKSGFWSQAGLSWSRAARLLLRWYADGRMIDNCIRMPREERQYRIAYRRLWLSRYDPHCEGVQLWPADGDERLRRELDE